MWNEVAIMTTSLPPYGRILNQRLSDHSNWPRWAGTSPDGLHPSIWIVAGGRNAWQWAANQVEHRLLALAPVDRDPTEFDWSALRHHAPSIILPLDHTSGEFIERLAVAIISAGCERILVELSGELMRYVRKVANT
jgi:hypothetical protein